MNILNYTVSNTNGSAKYFSCVRVYNSSNQMIAEQRINIGNPLGYLRARKKSKHIDSLYEQLVINNSMTVSDFNSIFWSDKT